MSQPDELEEILDAHATIYAQAVMDFITGKLTEDERDKEFHHSDLKTKRALLAWRDRDTEKKVREAKLLLLDSLDHNPQMFGDWQQVIEDERAKLENKGE